MPESPEPLPFNVPVRVDEVTVTVTDRGVMIRGQLPHGYLLPAGLSQVSIGDPSRAGVEWADVARWEHERDTAMLARALEDLAGMEPADAEALAAALRPLTPAGEEPAELVSRADLRRLVERSQVAGPEMQHAWGAYRAAGAERLTAWQAFVAGLRAAAEWRRG